MNPQELKEELTKAFAMKRVYYDKEVLREWENGNRFYLRNTKGGNNKSDTQYFKCTNNKANISSKNFSGKQCQIKTIETDKQNFNIGLLDGDPVILSCDPEHHWK